MTLKKLLSEYRKVSSFLSWNFKCLIVSHLKISERETLLKLYIYIYSLQNWDFYMEKVHSLRKQLTQQSNSWKSHLGGFLSEFSK